MPTDNFWMTDRIALLGTASDAVVAKRLGISALKVYTERANRRIPAYNRYRWGQTELALFRSYTDEEIAKMTGRSVTEIGGKRRELSK